MPLLNDEIRRQISIAAENAIADRRRGCGGKSKLDEIHKQEKELSTHTLPGRKLIFTRSLNSKTYIL